ncbi:MAG: ArsB/NhaD family transporter [Clostridia bacterium]
MILDLTICALAIVAMLALILFKPNLAIKQMNISIFWLAPVIGAVVLLACKLVDIGEVWASFTSSNAVNPLKILTLFISMTAISVFLDEVGFFRFLATATLTRAGVSQKKLFVYLYATVSFLTVFTSNDIIILTFTPFICYFAKNANINPTPYLFGEFVAANTWSMALIIGNPTNIYLASTFGVNFVEYLKYMIIPTICGGVTAFVLLILIFRKSLRAPIEKAILVPQGERFSDKFLVIVGLVALAVCTILLVISSYIGLEMWAICLGCALALFAVTLIYKLAKKQKPRELSKCLARLPWELIPFVLSMFVLVLSLDKCGFTEKFARALGGENTILFYGLSSALVANVINNIPMSVFYCSALAQLPTAGLLQGVFASVIGSNIGAFLTPVGALAGIMWSSILRHNGIKFSFVDFLKYGFAIAIPTLLASLGGLYLSFAIIG